MQQQHIQELLKATIPIVKEAGQFIIRELGKVQSSDIEDKSMNSLVSYVDRQAEKLLVEKLQVLLPDATFITEENTIQNQASEQTWIIDPLDGTTNFLHGIPHFAVSVGLRIEQQLTIGVVYEPNSDQCFYAGKGLGAFLNDKPIRVRSTGKLENALLATGFPYEDLQQVERTVHLIQLLKPKIRGIRRLGAAALDLAYVAAGKLDGYFEGCLNAWDIAAGILIVEEAGGIVSDANGGTNYLNNGQVVATSPTIHEALLEIVKQVHQNG